MFEKTVLCTSLVFSLHFSLISGLGNWLLTFSPQTLHICNSFLKYTETIFSLEILLVLHQVLCDALSCVLHLCVNQQRDSLLGITFVGVYGDVVRVKILFNKKDTALIQFNYVQQAQTGNFVLKEHNKNTKSLMTDPKGDSEFGFPTNLNVLQGDAN